jgi:uncharacterized membrane-anchored protein YitT (DUF2179 family)
MTTKSRLLLIFSGVLIFSLGNILFALPNYIMAGGITGLSTILYYVLNINLGLTLVVLNFPIFLIVWFFNKELVLQSLGSMVLCSIVIGALAPLLLPLGIKQIIPGSIIGGLVMGVGIWMLGRANSSFGGGTLVGKFLNAKYGISFSVSTFIVDFSAFPIAFIVIGSTETLFSIVLSFCSALSIRSMEFIVTKVSASLKPKEELQ